MTKTPDFEKAANEYAIQNRDIVRSSDYEIAEQSFLAGCEHAYSIDKETIERLEKEKRELHNKIMVQWEKDFGSIHNEQSMDAYTVSGFIKQVLTPDN